MAWWRVQAGWTVEGEGRSYAPEFTRTRLGAERVKRRMERTLRHFPTLVVTVQRASGEERAAARAREAEAESAPLPPVHVKPNDATRTACGLPADEVDAWIAPDLFTQTAEDRRCPECVRVRGS